MNKSAATQALEYLSETEEDRINVAYERCDADPAIWTFLGSSSLASTSSWASTVPKVRAMSATDDAVYTHQKKLRGGYDTKCAELDVQYVGSNPQLIIRKEKGCRVHHTGSCSGSTQKCSLVCGHGCMATSSANTPKRKAGCHTSC